MAVVTTQQSVAALYTAIFNRAPDQAGLTYWTAQIDAGASFADVAAGFTQHEVFTSGIGALDNASYVAALYTNILGSAGDAAGITYWIDRLAAGESKADVAAAFVQGSLTIDIAALLADGTLSAADAAAATIRQQTLLNKADTGIYFADTLGAASNLNPATVTTSKAGLEADPIYNASQAAIANVTNDPASVQTAKDAIAVAAGSDDPAGSLLGGTFTLTTGADTIVGGASSDVINALSINADGTPATTLSAFDSIDGGAGNDTLNIYTDGVNNAGSLTNVTVKNVETINYLNAGDGVAIDASKFEGATKINQTGTGAAGAVTNLASTTTAAFTGVTTTSSLSAINVSAAAAAASATLVLDGVKGGSVSNATSVFVDGAALGAVVISGSLVSNTEGATALLDLNVKAGAEVETVTVNSAFATELKVTETTGTVKHVTTIDTSAGAGDVTFLGLANNNVANIITGAGKDTILLNPALSATLTAASITTGAGDDVISVTGYVTEVVAGQTITVDAGEGNDAVNLQLLEGVGYNVTAGAGDDTVELSGTVKSTDKIDGGAGTDTISLAGKATLVADDYIVFNKVLTNFETLKLTGTAVTNLDAAQLAASYTTIDLSTGGIVDNVGTQALIANGALTAEALGYIGGTGSPATANTYAGTLNITDVSLAGAADAILAHAATVNLTVKGGSASGVTANNAVLTGEAQSAAVTLSAGTDTKGTAAVTDDTLVASKVTIATGTGTDALKDLASVTLSGNGAAVITNADQTKLVNVDASALNSVDAAGAATAGLTYTSSNTAAETIKLGAGVDTVTLNASTYGKADVVTGLNLVLNTAGTGLDATKSDVIHVASTVGTFTTFTTTQTDLDLALKDAAAYTVGGTASDNLVFQVSGNTYIYQDKGTAGSIDAADTVIQLTGLVNLDALAISLNQVA